MKCCTFKTNTCSYSMAALIDHMFTYHGQLNKSANQCYMCKEHCCTLVLHMSQSSLKAAAILSNPALEGGGLFAGDGRKIPDVCRVHNW